MLDYSSSCSAGRRNLAGARDEEFLYWDQGDEVQKQVAEVAKALYQRTDELAVLRARASTRQSLSSPLMFGCRGGAAYNDVTLHR